MKRVILLSGSPRNNGNTDQVMAFCAGELEKLGVATRLFHFSGQNFHSCVACGACRETGNCVLQDGLAPIIEELRQADGLIVGAPVYFGSARGDMMAALQRIGMVSRAHDQFLKRMVGGPIVIGRRGGLSATYQEMLMFYLINDMFVAGSTYWNLVYGKEIGEAMQDEEGLATVKRFAENTAWFIENKQ
jgi:multimeric flavodoxin WrbA